MHELSIAMGVVGGVLDEAERRKLGHVLAVHLRVGALAGVDKEALRFSYRVACAQTTLRDSRLVIEDVEVRIRCPHCGDGRRLRQFPALFCADCGQPAEAVQSGGELELAGVEVEA